MISIETVDDVMNKLSECLNAEFIPRKNFDSFLMEMQEYIGPFAVVPFHQQFIKLLKQLGQFLYSPFFDLLHSLTMMPEKAAKIESNLIKQHI
jgi:hypothetical protein